MEVISTVSDCLERSTLSKILLIYQSVEVAFGFLLHPTAWIFLFWPGEAIMQWSAFMGTTALVVHAMSYYVPYHVN